MSNDGESAAAIEHLVTANLDKIKDGQLAKQITEKENQSFQKSHFVPIASDAGSLYDSLESDQRSFNAHVQIEEGKATETIKPIPMQTEMIIADDLQNGNGGTTMTIIDKSHTQTPPPPPTPLATTESMHHFNDNNINLGIDNDTKTPYKIQIINNDNNIMSPLISTLIELDKTLSRITTYARQPPPTSPPPPIPINTNTHIDNKHTNDNNDKILFIQTKKTNQKLTITEKAHGNENANDLVKVDSIDDDYIHSNLIPGKYFDMDSFFFDFGSCHVSH